MKHLLTHIFLLFITSVVTAQQSKLRAKFDGEKVIVKIFNQNIYNQSAYDFYRKSSTSDWEKINNTPIVFNPDQLSEKDLNENYKIVSKLHPNKLEGFAKLIVLSSFIHDNEYARFIGSAFYDNTAVQGQVYSYKVTNDKKETIAQLDDFKVENISIKSPTNISLEENHLSCKINWEEDNEMSFGVNLYKREKGKTEWYKVNNKPIIPFGGTSKEDQKPFKFEDKSVTLNQTYEYQIKAIDLFGFEGQGSQIIEYTAKDLIIPEQVTELRSEVNNETNEITLNWKGSESEDLSHYKVTRFRENNKDSIILAENVNKTTTVFVDKNVPTGVYQYTVVAVDLGGNENPKKTNILELLDVDPPKKPQNVVLTPDTGKIEINWTPNSEADLLGYRIYRTINKNSDKLILVSKDIITSNSFVEKLEKKTKNNLVYKIVAIDTSYNQSEYSEPTIGKLPDVTPPLPPHISVVTNNDSIYQIQWIASTSLDTKFYNVYHKCISDSVSEIQKVNRTEVSQLQFNSTSFKDGKTYTFYITAVDSIGNESELSNGKSLAFKKETKPEISISNFKAKIRQGKASLQWDISGNDFIGVVIYRYDSLHTNGTPISKLITENSYKDTAINSGSYDYQLRAYDSKGNIIKSEKINLELKQ